MSRNGHSTSGWALVTGCGSFCVAPEKKFAILSFKDGELGAAADAGGGAAPADAGAGGTALLDAVVAGAPTPPPLHPASNSNANIVPAGDRWRQPDPGNVRLVPRIVANSRSPIDWYSKLMATFPRR
jgi:hypothetical protein